MGRIIGIIILLGALSFTGGFLFEKHLNNKNVGSVQQASEYHVTSTLGGFAANDYFITSRAGTLGSIVITSSSATTFTVYDADTATSTPTTTIAHFPISAAVGTYTFDAVLEQGLVITIPANWSGAFTVTYR